MEAFARPASEPLPGEVLRRIAQLPGFRLSLVTLAARANAVAPVKVQQLLRHTIARRA
jgi:hypothetical protein